MIKKILFVCTGNTCRSSMAGALAWELAKKYWNGSAIQVVSAGTHAYEGAPASEGAIEAMRIKGINLEQHQATLLSRELVEEADLLLVMTPSHKAYILDWFPEVSPKVFLLKDFALEGQFEGSPAIGDPFGQPVKVYQAVAEELRELVDKAFIRIRREEGNP